MPFHRVSDHSETTAELQAPLSAASRCLTLSAALKGAETVTVSSVSVGGLGGVWVVVR